MSLVSLLIISVRLAFFSENENARKRNVYRHPVAEMVGFEPTYRLPDKRISSAPRYDHFDTSPCIKSSYNRILPNAPPVSQPERFGATLERHSFKNASSTPCKVLYLLHLTVRAKT